MAWLPSFTLMDTETLMEKQYGLLFHHACISATDVDISIIYTHGYNHLEKCPEGYTYIDNSVCVVLGLELPRKTRVVEEWLRRKLALNKNVYTCTKCVLRLQNNGLVFTHIDLVISHLHVTDKLQNSKKVNSIIRPNHGPQTENLTYV